MRAAMVVAHPDDETLWGAGWILTNPQDDFTVICCSTPRIDPERARQFFDACTVLGVRGTVLSGRDHPSRALELNGVDLTPYAYVVTHNNVGEYGHLHHVQVHKYVAENFKGPIVNFGHGLKKASHLIALGADAAATKLRALQCYSNVSPTDRRPKWQALLERYFNNDTTRFGEETYVQFR